MSFTVGARTRAIQVAVLSFVALVAPCGTAAAADHVPDATFAASVNPAGEYAEGGVLGDPTISADGRFVAFVSASANLTSEGSGIAQAYVKDLDTGEVTLESRAEGAAGPAADAGVENSLFSADGRYLVFQSAAEDLVTGLPTPATTHVYRRNLRTAETTLVDRADGSAGEIVPLGAAAIAISADGRMVAFYDTAQELDDPLGAHAAGEEMIYVRDMASGTTIEVAAEGAEEAAFSVDDRYLLFTSAAATLPEATGAYEAFRRDLQSGETLLVSRANPSSSAPAGEPANGEAYEAVFVGASDCQVAFAGEGTTNLNPAGEDPDRGVYLYDFCGSSASTSLISIDEEGQPFEEAIFPTTTGDGRIAFLAQVHSFEAPHLYLRDGELDETTLLDRADGVEGEPSNGEIADHGAASIAAAGNRAIFTTDANNLFGEEVAIPAHQTFVRQLPPRRLKLSPPTTPGDGGASASGSTASDGAATAAAAGAALARRIGLVAIGRREVQLSFDGAGRARLRIQRLVVNGRGDWRLVEDAFIDASGAGVFGVELPRLPAGRYRIKVRLQGDPDNPTFGRPLPASVVPPA